MKPEVIGYACDLAANEIGAANGPFVLQKSEYLKPLDLKWIKILETKAKGRQLEAIDAIQAICKKLALQTMHRAREAHPFLILGGDHSSAIGTWSGAANGLKDPLGLIWVDAHMDAHTPKSSLSHNIHGMPLAALLGYGDPKLTQIETEHFALLPDNLVLIGVRSYEEQEAKLLDMLKIRIYFKEEVEKRGLHQVMQEAIKHVTEKTNRFGISIDLDALDPIEVPGVSVLEENGLHVEELLESLRLVSYNPHFIGAEIAEFNPKNDRNHKTEKVIGEIIEALFFKD